jgi:hypothetical protein
MDSRSMRVIVSLVAEQFDEENDEALEEGVVTLAHTESFFHSDPTLAAKLYEYLRKELKSHDEME